MGCLQKLNEFLDFIYENLQFSNIANIYIGKKRERGSSKTKKKKRSFKRISNINKHNNKIINIISSENGIKINQKNDNSLLKRNGNGQNAIVNYFSHLNLQEMYSYKLMSRIHSFKFEKGKEKEKYFRIALQNDGPIRWPENNSYLKLKWINCDEVKVNDVLLGALEVDQIELFNIKFYNLYKFIEKKNYISVFEESINDKSIGEKIIIHFKVKEEKV